MPNFYGAYTKVCIWHLHRLCKVAIPEYSLLIPGPLDMNDTQTGVAAVDRALLILSVFREGDSFLTLALLARRTGLYKSTILRLLQSLLRAGYVVRRPDGNYAIGPEPSRLAKMYQATADTEGNVK